MLTFNISLWLTRLSLVSRAMLICSSINLSEFLQIFQNYHSVSSPAQTLLPSVLQLSLKTVNLLIPLAAPGFVPVVRNVGLD